MWESCFLASRGVDAPDHRGIVVLVVEPRAQRPNWRWRRGVVVSGVRRMNEVNARRARLVFGWVTVFGRVYHIGM